MDIAILLVSVVAALAATAGLAIMWRQLSLAREVARGRGLLLTARPSPTVTVSHGVQRPRDVWFSVEAAGPGRWSEVAGFLMSTDGTPVEQLWTAVPALTNADEPIEAKRTMGNEDMQHTYFVVTWADPAGDALQTMAARVLILPPSDSDRPASQVPEQFIWHRTHQLRYWWQSKRGKHRPLGRWKPVPAHSYTPKQVPGLPL